MWLEPGPHNSNQASQTKRVVDGKNFDMDGPGQDIGFDDSCHEPLFSQQALGQWQGCGSMIIQYYLRASAEGTHEETEGTITRRPPDGLGPEPCKTGEVPNVTITKLRGPSLRPPHGLGRSPPDVLGLRRCKKRSQTSP